MVPGILIVGLCRCIIKIFINVLNFMPRFINLLYKRTFNASISNISCSCSIVLCRSSERLSAYRNALFCTLCILRVEDFDARALGIGGYSMIDRTMVVYNHTCSFGFDLLNLFSFSICCLARFILLFTCFVKPVLHRISPSRLTSLVNCMLLSSTPVVPNLFHFTDQSREYKKFCGPVHTSKHTLAFN